MEPSQKPARLGHVRVEDAMHPGVITCPAETPLREVARILTTKHIHCVVIPQIAGHGAQASWSLLTALDLVGAAGEGIEDRTAVEIAATEPVTVSADDRLDRAAQLMAEHQVGHLIVVGAADGRPVGVLSTLDVAGVLAWE